MLSRLGNRLFEQSAFVRHVSTLSAGTLIAQIILLLASPIISRLYTPVEFGIYAFLLACVSVLSPAICGKYDVAILLPRSDRMSDNLAALCIQISAFLGLFFLIIALVWVIGYEPMVALRNAEKWLLMVPVVLFITGLSMVFNSMANRRQAYQLLAKSKIAQAFSIVITNVVLGLMGFGFVGLLLGNVVGLLLYIYLLQRKLTFTQDFSITKRKLVAGRKYREFPIYNATSSLLGGVAINLPIFFISAYYPESYLGFYALVTRVINTPLSFISVSVSQINLKKVVNLAHEKIRITPYLVKLMAVLVLVVSPVVVVLYFFAEPLFGFVFGGSWSEAGWLASILAPALGLRFVVSTLSTTISATNNNKYLMYWKVGAFLVTFCTFAYFAPRMAFNDLIGVYVFIDMALYFIYLMLIFLAASRPRVS